MRYASDISNLIGHTPLLKISKLSGEGHQVFAKLESMNPYSVKDRPAKAMLEAAERQGLLKPGYTIVEPTSGNTGISLAAIAAVKGYKMILTMPESMSPERVGMLKALGARVVLTPAAKGMNGSIEEAKRILKENPHSFMPAQFENPANPAAHQSTAQEIWEDTDGQVAVFVAGVGTGGTLSGVGRWLKEKKPEVQIIAVEPAASAVLSGHKAAPHKIQGIGAGFVPKNFDRKVVDDIIPVTDENAAQTVHEMARKEGILCGVSGGANIWAALQVAKRPENKDKVIVTVIPDSGERYLSTWLFQEPDKTAAQS